MPHPAAFPSRSAAQRSSPLCHCLNLCPARPTSAFLISFLISPSRTGPSRLSVVSLSQLSDPSHVSHFPPSGILNHSRTDNVIEFWSGLVRGSHPFQSWLLSQGSSKEYSSNWFSKVKFCEIFSEVSLRFYSWWIYRMIRSNVKRLRGRLLLFLWFFRLESASN